MDNALIQVGLPVKCSWGDCEATGFVKPATDYGGWSRHWRRKWYCPEHTAEAKLMYDKSLERYKTPGPAKNELQDLMDLI